MKTKLKEEFKMLNVLLLIVCIYVALVGASLTIMIVACSKWYMDKTTNMTKNMFSMFDDDENE